MIFQKAKTGIFIDGSNMLWGSRKSNKRIDWFKFKIFLEAVHKIQVLNYYACEDNNPLPKYVKATDNQKKFYRYLEGIGYKMIRKNLKHLACGDTKCDMDVEITMDIRNYENDFDTLILFTGDSDYLPVVEYYWNKGKTIKIFSFKELLSWELKTFALNNPRASFTIINEIEADIFR